MTMEREKRGDSCYGEKKVLIAKVKGLITRPARQGKSIPISVCNLNKKNYNDFLFPVLLNTIIEHNLVESKYSPHAGVLHSLSMYMFNYNEIFVQVRKGKTLAKLVNRGGDKAVDRDRKEDGPGVQSHHHPPSCSWNN